MRLLIPAAWLAAAALAFPASARVTSAVQPSAATPAASIRFEDVAASAGLAFTHDHGPTPDKHIIESVPGGVAVFDVDNDGRADVFFTNGATSPGLVKTGERFANRLFRNEGGGKFLDVTARAGVSGVGYAMGAAAADFDNDGHVDLFVTGVDRHQLLRNLGDGRFEDVTTHAGIRAGEWAAAAGWLDVDRDGRLDLFVANYLRWTPAFDRYCGDDARRIRVYCHPRYFEGMANRLYRNKGDGRFEDVTTASGIGRHVGKGMSVAMLDADRDGWVDIFVTNDGVPNFLFHNKGDGTFDEVGLLAGVSTPSHGRAVSSMGVDAQDYDRDGAADLAVTALTGETFPLFRGDGRGAFLEATHTSGLAVLSARRSGWCAAFIDADNDGWLDLFTSNSHVNDRIDAFESTTWKQANSLFRNRGDGAFADAAGAGFASRVAAHRGCAPADLDGDGRVDLVVSALGDAAELWRNVPSNDHHWIAVRLVGTKSNRDGLGARVTIGPQARMMTTSVGYASSAHAPLHFGLGARAMVDRIEVVWPSGAKQVVEKPEIDRVVTVTEP
jgi:enediyne biosynthesis protein E4